MDNVKLKALVTEVEFKALPAAMQEYYSKSGESYVLDVEDKEYTAKIKEFRDTNINLKTKTEELQKVAEKYKDVDLEKYQLAMEELGKLDEIAEKDLIKAGKFEQVVNTRLQAKAKEWEIKLQQAEAKRVAAEQDAQRYKGMHSKLVVETTGVNHITSVGVPRKNALPLLTNLVHETFTTDEQGKVVPREGKVNNKGEPLSMEEFGKGLLQEHAYLFDAATGGGAGGGNKGTGAGGHVTVIDRDPVTFGQNAAGIVKGTVAVRGGE